MRKIPNVYIPLSERKKLEREVYTMNSATLKKLNGVKAGEVVEIKNNFYTFTPAKLEGFRYYYYRHLISQDLIKKYEKK